jgi:hypothetical protein
MTEKITLRGWLLLLYGFSFFGTVLDMSMTRTGLALGAAELNATPRILFNTVGIEATDVFRVLLFGLFVVSTELVYWCLIPKLRSSIILSKGCSLILVGVWTVVFVSLCFTFANNIVVLQHVSYFMVMEI